jgi:hypothetical protein
MTRLNPVSLLPFGQKIISMTAYHLFQKKRPEYGTAFVDKDVTILHCATV